jgi:hypothetical protein
VPSSTEFFTPIDYKLKPSFLKASSKAARASSRVASFDNNIKIWHSKRKTKATKISNPYVGLNYDLQGQNSYWNITSYFSFSSHR